MINLHFKNGVVILADGLVGLALSVSTSLDDDSLKTTTLSYN